MKTNNLPIPFMFGGAGAAAIRLQYISQYVSNLEGNAAVFLGVIMLLFTSYSIYFDWIWMRKTGREMKKVNLLLGGYVLCLVVIFVSPENEGLGRLLFSTGIISTAIFGYFFYKEKCLIENETNK
jgi:hypothetical protein